VTFGVLSELIPASSAIEQQHICHLQQQQQLKTLHGILLTCRCCCYVLFAYSIAATLAVGVAAGGLLAMFWVGTFITGAARSLKHLEEPAAAAPPPPQKSLAELIADRKVRACMLLCCF
jgi:hypothetical protein